MKEFSDEEYDVSSTIKREISFQDIKAEIKEHAFNESEQRSSDVHTNLKQELFIVELIMPNK